MTMQSILTKSCLSLILLASSQVLWAQSASTGVDVGPGNAGAWGTANGQFQRVETDSRVGPNGTMARGLAIGAGPNGLAISHSIGLNQGGVGVGHNFNLSIGPGGAHISGGNVSSQGGNSRVIAGGQSNVGGLMGPPSGGSSVIGFGRHTHAQTHAQTMPFPPRPPMGPFLGSRMNRMPRSFPW